MHHEQSNWKETTEKGLYLLDSLQASGKAMPERFLEPMKEVFRTAIHVSHRKSCRFGTLFVLPGGRLARQYYLADDPDGSWQSYLRIMDLMSKSVSEMPLPKGTKFKAVWKDWLGADGGLGCDPRGYLKLSSWEVAD
jgi:hypothetical protein